MVGCLFDIRYDDIPVIMVHSGVYSLTLTSDAGPDTGVVAFLDAIVLSHEIVTKWSAATKVFALLW